MGVWGGQYGSAPLSAVSAAPEPTTVLALVALCMAMSRRRSNTQTLGLIKLGRNNFATILALEHSPYRSGQTTS